MDRIFSLFSLVFYFSLPHIFLNLWCLLQLIFKLAPTGKTNEQTAANINWKTWEQPFLTNTILGLSAKRADFEGGHNFCWRTVSSWNDGMRISDIFLCSLKNTIPSRFSGTGSIVPSQDTDGLEDSFQLHGPAVVNVNETVLSIRWMQ